MSHEDPGGRQPHGDQPAASGGNPWGQQQGPHPWGQPVPPDPGVPFGLPQQNQPPSGFGATGAGTNGYNVAGPNPYTDNPYGQPRYTAPPKPGIVPLRPLMFGEILDGSFQTIRRNAGAMLGAALLAQSFAAILAAVMTVLAATPAFSLEAWLANATPADLASLGLGFSAAVLLVALLTIFLSAVLQGAMVVPVARSILNRPTGFRQMWALTRSRAWTLIRLATLLMGAVLLSVLIAAVLGFILVSTMEGAAVLLLIPLVPVLLALFIWVSIKIIVAPAAVVIEELGARDALRRSWALTRANWWRIFGIIVVVSIMIGVIGQVVTIPVSLLPVLLSGFISPHGGSEEAIALALAVGVVTAIVTALIGAVGYAFQTSVMALIYLDLRMRKDGLDIALLRMLETGENPEGLPGRGLTFQGPLRGAGGTGTWPHGR